MLINYFTDTQQRLILGWEIKAISKKEVLFRKISKFTSASPKLGFRMGHTFIANKCIFLHFLVLFS